LEGTAAPAHAFTVFTPTFNRAHTLGRVYDSLKAQTMSDFEWLVVDDGSTDETRELVERWAGEAAFPVRYFHQRNSGKHVAENVAVREARGQFIATVDSDDWYVPDALETFLSAWQSIAESERDGFAGVVGLCSDAQGALVGTPFPTDVFDTTYTALAMRHDVAGDKAGCGRTDVVREFPFPVVPGESLILEFLVYNRMAQRYRIRCVNRVIKVVEYQASGLSAMRATDYRRNPRTAKLFFLEQLNIRPIPVRMLIRVYANHTRYSLHAGLVRQGLRESPSKVLWGATLPFALSAYARDRVRMNRDP
jgi:glycosyltransferase involved in cell wall biosynthesis